MRFNRPVRKLFSLLLMALLGLTVVEPLFALEDVSGAVVPACCRRNGTHHCEMINAQQQGDPQSGTRMGALMPKCPYSPVASATPHVKLLAPGRSAGAFAVLLGSPMLVAQTASKRQMSSDRSRQKRGPPSSLLL